MVNSMIPWCTLHFTSRRPLPSDSSDVDTGDFHEALVLLNWRCKWTNGVHSLEPQFLPGVSDLFFTFLNIYRTRIFSQRCAEASKAQRPSAVPSGVFRAVMPISKMIRSQVTTVISLDLENDHFKTCRNYNVIYKLMILKFSMFVYQLVVFIPWICRIPGFGRMVCNN